MRGYAGKIIISRNMLLTFLDTRCSMLDARYMPLYQTVTKFFENFAVKFTGLYIAFNQL